MDGGALEAAVHGVAKSRTRLSAFTFTFHFHALEKEMATQSSVLAWRIPEMGKPGGLPSVGSHRIGYDWSNLGAAAEMFKPVQFSQSVSSVAQSCPTLCNPTDCSTPGLPVHHQLPELAQTHVHQVGDAIHSSHPLLSTSPPAFNLSQHQGLFLWVSSSHQGAKVLGVSASASVLPVNIQDWIPLGWTGWIFLQTEGISRVFSNTTV